MVWWRTIADEEGRRLPVYRPMRRAMCRIPADEFLEIRKSMCHAVQRTHSPVLVILLMTGLGLLTGMASGIFPPAAWWGFAVLLILIGLWQFIDGRSLPTRNPKLIASALLDRHRCPSCAASLEGQKRRADGVTECPECRGVWRLERVRYTPELE